MSSIPHDLSTTHSSESVNAQLIAAKSVCFRLHSSKESAGKFFSAGEKPPNSYWLADWAQVWEQFVVSPTGAGKSVTIRNVHFNTFLSCDDGSSITQVPAVFGDGQKWLIDSSDRQIALYNLQKRLFLSFCNPHFLFLKEEKAFFTPVLSQKRDGAWHTEPLLLDVLDYMPPPHTAAIDVGAEARAAHALLAHLVRRQRVVEKMLLPLAARVITAGNLSADALLAFGYPDAGELKAAGLGPKELASAGFAPRQLKDLGFAPVDLCELPLSLKELQTLGLSAVDARLRGNSLADIIATFGSRATREAGFTAKDFKDAKISAETLKSAGFDLLNIKGSGYTYGELCNAEWRIIGTNSSGQDLFGLIFRGNSDWWDARG